MEQVKTVNLNGVMTPVRTGTRHDIELAADCFEAFERDGFRLFESYAQHLVEAVSIEDAARQSAQLMAFDADMMGRIADKDGRLRTLILMTCAIDTDGDKGQAWLDDYKLPDENSKRRDIVEACWPMFSWFFFRRFAASDYTLDAWLEIYISPHTTKVMIAQAWQEKSGESVDASSVT